MPNLDICAHCNRFVSGEPHAYRDSKLEPLCHRVEGRLDCITLVTTFNHKMPCESCMEITRVPQTEAHFSSPQYYDYLTRRISQRI